MDNTENSTPTRLLILGNGFDLQAGLKSSFNDYYDSLDSELINELNLSYHELDNESGFDKFYDSLKRDVISQLARKLLPLRRKTDWTFWDYILFFEHSDKNNNNWADVETSIQIFLESGVNELIALHDKLSHYRRQRFNEVNITTILLFYIIFYVFELIPSQNNELELNHFLINQLNQFENKFKIYLNGQIHDQDKSTSYTYEEKAAKILKALGHKEISNILSFNYTVPIAIENNTNLQMKIRNVHGDLKSHIIIGIDQATAKDNKNNYLFTKTYRIMELANDKKENHSLDPNIKSIVFYGHSLNDADYSYFLSIFDYYNLYDSNVTLIFYYSLYPPKMEDSLTDDLKKQIIVKHNDDLKKIQYDRILSLINKYGSTLSNDHGDNLLHKLLLEDRLIIKELSYMI